MSWLSELSRVAVIGFAGIWAVATYTWVLRQIREHSNRNRQQHRKECAAQPLLSNERKP